LEFWVGTSAVLDGRVIRKEGLIWEVANRRDADDEKCRDTNEKKVYIHV
jgi:hypothetical protein